MASQTRSAIIVKSAGNAIVESGVDMPKLEAGDILIRNTIVALNPVDHAFVDYMAQAGAVLGCDYAVRRPCHIMSGMSQFIILTSWIGCGRGCW